MTASGGVGPYTYALSAGALPAGLALSSGGTISGTPSTTGTSSFTIRATDSTAASGTRAYALSVGTFSLTILPTSLPASTQGTPYSQTLTAVGGTAPYTYTVSSGSLPPGLSLDPSSGVLDGTPTTPGAYSFIVQATDANGNSGFRTYNLSTGTPGGLTVNPPTLPNGTQGVGYSQTIAASGGTAPYSYSITAGALPAGITLNGSTGALSGTPSGSGTFSFTVRALDADGNTGTRAYTLNIGSNSLTLSPTSLPNGTQTVPYNRTVTASGGVAPYTYSISAGSLPTGLALDTSTGAISGTPSATGTFAFTVRAIDANANFGTRAYSVTIGSNTLVINPSALPGGTTGSPYNQTVSASGGTAPYTYAISAGSLPAGLSLNASSGAISGTPTTAGSSSFTIGATDGNGNTGSRAYTIPVTLAALVISPPTLSPATQGAAYSQTVTASGGTAPYSYAITAGALPGGLALNSSTGAISGTPSVSGTFGFTVQATDATPNTGSRAYTLNVGTNSLTVSPASLPAGTQSTPYSQTIAASGGTGPYTFAVSSGALPAGLALNAASGVISGTPSAGGTSSFTVQATDSVGNTGNRPYSLTIGTNSLTLNPATLPGGTTGASYSRTLTTTGGTGPYTYAITAGALPAGLTLNAGSGLISGTPSAAGSSSFTVQSLDSVGNTGSRPYTMSIGTNSLTVNPAALPPATQNLPYNQAVTASGGTAPYSYAITSGTLPAGLTIDSATGAIAGTPSASGTFTFTVQATDAVPNTGSRTYSLTVGTNSLTVSPASLPAGTRAARYAQTFTAGGGTGPYTFAVSTGVLPAGLALNATTGAVTGTPSGSGPSAFTIQATDATGNVGGRAYAMNIGINSLTINPATLPDATQSLRYSHTVTATGGTAPYNYSVSAGALPAGLTLDPASGVIGGTAGARGIYSFTIFVRDIAGNTGSRAYSVTTSRPDPSNDPEVRALVAAQAATARRFASSQTTNVGRHLESLHGGFNPCELAMGVNLSSSEPVGSYDPMTGIITPVQPTAAEQVARRMPNQPCDRAFGFWAGGAVEFGSATPSGAAAASKFTTSGITAGADMRLNDRLILGVGIGYGLDSTDVSQNGTKSSANTFSGMLYGSWNFRDSWFIDGMVGYGTLNFDNKRFVTADGSIASGSRTGETLFGSISLGTELQAGALKLFPYIRADFLSAALGRYAEDGGGVFALTYDKTDVASTTASLGLRGSIDLETSWGTLTPQARFEYRYAMDGNVTQSLAYSDAPGTSYALKLDNTTRETLLGAVGLRARFNATTSIELEYAMTGSPASGQNNSQTIRAALRLGF